MASQTRVKVAKFDAPKMHGLDRDAARSSLSHDVSVAANSTTAKSSSSARTKSTSRSPAPAMKPSLPPAGLAPSSRRRLDLSLLSRSRSLPDAGRYAARDSAAGRWRERRSQFRRPADAFALGPSRLEYRQPLVLHRHAIRPGRGAAEATLYYQHHPKLWESQKMLRSANTSVYEDNEIVYVSSGDGATSEGEFWESLNTACTKKLPMFYLIEDNGYAISVPVEVQTAGGSISKLVAVSLDCTSPNAMAPIRWKVTPSAAKPIAVLPRTSRPLAGSRPRHAPVLALAFR